MKENQKLVTIARFENEFEAQQAKIPLEEAGIHAVICGEILGGAGFPYTGKANFVELQVFEEDREQAEAILEEQLGTADEDENMDEEEEQGDLL